MPARSPASCRPCALLTLLPEARHHARPCCRPPVQLSPSGSTPCAVSPASSPGPAGPAGRSPDRRATGIGTRAAGVRATDGPVPVAIGAGRVADGEADDAGDAGSGRRPRPPPTTSRIVRVWLRLERGAGAAATAAGAAATGCWSASCNGLRRGRVRGLARVGGLAHVRLLRVPSLGRRPPCRTNVSATRVRDMFGECQSITAGRPPTVRRRPPWPTVSAARKSLSHA